MQPRCVQWCEVNGRKYHVVGGIVSHAVDNPTFDPVAKAGAMHDYFRGNPNKLQPYEFLREREPIPAEYRDRDARIAKLDEFGLEAVWLFPTLGILYEELLKHDIEAVTTLFTAFNRWLDDDWGLDYQGTHLRVAVHHARRPRLGDPRARVGDRPRRAHDRDAPGRAAHRDGQIPASDPRNDPFWARVNEAGITVVAHAGDSGYSSNGYAVDGFAAGFSGNGRWAPSVKAFHIERAAYDFLITLVFDKLFERFPNVRVASVENGSEFLRDLFNKLRSTDQQDAGLLHRGSGRVVQAQRVDEPVLGRRRQRGRRAHGRRPRDLRLRLAAHRRHAASRSTTRSRSSSSTTPTSSASCATTRAS